MYRLPHLPADYNTQIYRSESTHPKWKCLQDAERALSIMRSMNMSYNLYIRTLQIAIQQGATLEEMGTSEEELRSLYARCKKREAELGIVG